VVTDLAYVDGDEADVRQRLDLYLPAEDRPPLVVFIHGGSWREGSKDYFALVGKTLQARDLACAVVGYRLTPQVKHPAHVQDCARAVAWLVEHADEFGWNEKRIYLMGHSSGAHLAALLALDESYLQEVGVDGARVCGVLALSGPYDVRMPIPMFTEVFGEDSRTRRRASPLDWVREDVPPFLVLWAEHEMLGLGASGVNFRTHLRKHGARVEWGELRGRNHATILTTMGTDEDITTPRLVRFIERVERGWEREPKHDEHTGREKR
jgi:acetyl esterase/lipase